MEALPCLVPDRRRYRAVVEPISEGAWHVTVRELPKTWTVAFDRSEVERRARHRIALDLGVHPDDFDVVVVWSGGAA
jgi:predicted RNase H-like HicB family nuclease